MSEVVEEYLGIPLTQQMAFSPHAQTAFTHLAYARVNIRAKYTPLEDYLKKRFEMNITRAKQFIDSLKGKEEKAFLLDLYNEILEEGKERFNPK
ncbi:MAG: hypothetical protein H3Z53_03050 [archaeon]|nr:hypothetical protein [archaeon]